MSMSLSVFPRGHGDRVWSVSMFLFCGASLCSSRHHLLSVPGNWLEPLDFTAINIIIQSCLAVCILLISLIGRDFIILASNTV